MLCNFETAPSKGRTHKECKESTMQLDYSEEEREEGELSDTEEEKQQKEQQWWRWVRNGGVN